MKTASISNAKNRFSALIDLVRRGETVIITDRDQPVAQLAPLPAQSVAAATRLAEAASREGLLVIEQP